jgi:hypothetical protein
MDCWSSRGNRGLFVNIIVRVLCDTGGEVSKQAGRSERSWVDQRCASCDYIRKTKHLILLIVLARL